MSQKTFVITYSPWVNQTCWSRSCACTSSGSHSARATSSSRVAARRLFFTRRRVADRLRPSGPGDRGGAGVGRECVGVGEAGSVVADLSEYAGAGEVAEAGEAGDDLVVGVLGEDLGDGLAELVDAGALGV